MNLLKARLTPVHHTGLEAYLFKCPGCRDVHMVVVGYDPDYRLQSLAAGRNCPEWEWNGCFVDPTFNPSILVRKFNGDQVIHVCHCFIIAGNIQFLPDSTHRLRGQTIEMLDAED